MQNSTFTALGAMIRDYRKNSGMTQQELAEKLGYDSTQFVSLFERGLSKVPLNVLGQLIVILNIPEKTITKILFDDYKARMTDEISGGKKKAQDRKET